MTENEAIEILNIHRTFNNGLNAVEAIDIAIEALKEIQPYHEIGTVEECREARERQNAFCEPKYLGENVVIGCRDGKCSCGNIVRSYQNYCDSCGMKLEWGNVWEQAKEKKGGKVDED